MSESCTQTLKTNSHTRASVLCLPMSLWGENASGLGGCLQIIITSPCVAAAAAAYSLPHLADGTISTSPLHPSLSTESKARILNVIVENGDERKIVQERAVLLRPCKPENNPGLNLPTCCLLDWLSFAFYSFLCVVI